MAKSLPQFLMMEILVANSNLVYFYWFKKKFMLIHVICLRGDSVSKKSIVLKRNEGPFSAIGDKVDLRVVAKCKKNGRFDQRGVCEEYWKR